MVFIYKRVSETRKRVKQRFELLDSLGRGYAVVG